MKKQKEKIKVNKLNKNVRYFLWTIFGILMLGGFVFATTNFITEQGITTPNGVFSGNVSVGGNLNVTGIIIPKSEGISSSDLLVYYPLDSNTLDYSGNGNDLSTLVSTSFSSGRIGNALNFNTNGYAKSITSPHYFPLSGKQTVCLWNKVLNSNDGNQEFFFFSPGGTNNRLYLNKELNGKMRYTIGSTSTDFLLPSQYSNNTWNHFCVIRDYDNLRGLAYWNGVLASNVSVTIGTSTPSIIMLGTNGPIDGSSVNKLVDDVRVYNKSLSSDEIAQIYQSNQESNPISGSVRATNKVGYIENNGVDIVTQYNNLISNGATRIIASAGSYTTGNTLSLTTADITLDFTGINYTYNGTGSAIYMNRSSRLMFDFNRILVSGNAQAGIEENHCGLCTITGKELATTGNGNFTIAGLYINNIDSTSGGENTWKIRNILGSGRSLYGIYIPNQAIGQQQGDKFETDWIYRFTNESVKVGDSSNDANGYYWFDIGMDNCGADCSYNVTSFITNWRSSNTFNIRYMVANSGTDVIMKSSATNNVIMSGKSTMTYLDQGSKNTFLSYNSQFNNINALGNITQSTNAKHCLDGSTCSHYITYNGTDTIIQ